MSLNNHSSLPHFLLQAAAKEGSSFMAFSSSDPADHIKVGSFYEIDHSKLPPKSPHQLTSIRIVMVNEKTRMRVSLRFPSIISLRAYFNDTTAKSDMKKLPSLEERYTMGSEVAADALYRRITPAEITQKKNIWRFWAVPSIAAHKLLARSPSNDYSRSRTSTINTVPSTKSGSLWSQIKDAGMVKWGQRRQVSYLARHIVDEDDNKRPLSLSCKVMRKGEEENSEQSDDDNEDDDDDDVMKKTKNQKGKPAKNLKRKERGFSNNETIQNQNKKKKKICKSTNNEKNNQIVVYKQKKHKVIKNSIDGWSAER